MNVLVIALDAAGQLDWTTRRCSSSRRRSTPDCGTGSRTTTARAACASERLAACLDRLERAGLHATGRVGDADPLQAVADTLPTFAADEIVIAAHSERSRGIAEKIAPGVRERFALPVHDAEGVWRRAAA